MQGRHRRLKYLRDKPLGGYLFANLSLQRKQLRLASITRKDPLFRVALSQSAQECPRIWGRRSLLTLDRKALLVSEFFLPELFLHKP